MKRTIIYVFGPKRLASEYQNGSEKSISQESTDVTNWLKIGLTTTEDNTLDKWDAAKNRICQESRTGIPETCVILDVFEYPFLDGKADDEIRRLMTEDVYKFANSKANNGLIENKYEIKAGQEFVYGASRSHVLAAIAKFERNLIIKTFKHSKDKLEDLIQMIQSNMDDVADEQEETSANTSQQDTSVFDSFYEKLIAAMPSYIGERCNHTIGKNYMTIRTNRTDCKWYYLAFSVKRGTTAVQLETYDGQEGKESVDQFILKNDITSILPQLEPARQGKSESKFSWDIHGEYKGDEETVIKWFVNNTKKMFDAFEPNVKQNNHEDIITIEYNAPFNSFGSKTPTLSFQYDYNSGSCKYTFGDRKLSDKDISTIISFLNRKYNIERFFDMPETNEGVLDCGEFITISYMGRNKTISQNVTNRKYDHPFMISDIEIINTTK